MAHIPEAKAMLGRTVEIGNLTLSISPESFIFRPASGAVFTLMFLGGIFGLIAGFLTLALVVMAVKMLFGWHIPFPDMSAFEVDSTAFWGVVYLSLSLLPGIFAAMILASVVHTLRFWRHPTVFDCAAGMFMCGGNKVCGLDEISEVSLRRITDPKYPHREKYGLAVALCDSSLHRLEPPAPFLSFLSRSNHKTAEFYTDLGEFRQKDQQEAVLRVTEELAARLGVSVKEHHEQGRFSADPKM